MMDTSSMLNQSMMSARGLEPTEGQQSTPKLNLTGQLGMAQAAESNMQQMMQVSGRSSIQNMPM